MKAAITVIAAMIWITGCNREAKQDQSESSGEAAARQTEEEARQTGRDMEEAGKQSGSKVEEEGRQTSRDIKEGAEKAGAKTQEEARQSGRDIKEGAQAAGSKTKEEARQTSRDIKEAVSGDQAKTDADKQLNARIREALKKDKAVASEADDVDIRTENGKVELQGTVTSKEAKQEIARIAGDIAGKTMVQDKVKVAERVGTGPE